MVDYKSSREEKFHSVKERLSDYRHGFDTLTEENLHTRLTAVRKYCGECFATDWFGRLSVLNANNGKQVIIEAWWHGETRPQYRITEAKTGEHIPHKDAGMITTVIMSLG